MVVADPYAALRHALPQTSIPLDPEALDLYVRAADLGAMIAKDRPDDPPVTFTAGMVALFTGQDRLSLWFRAAAEKLGPDRKRVLAAAKLDEGKLAAAGGSATAAGPWPSPLLTASSRTVLASADEWARDVGAQELGIRHLLAAYLINPPANHRKQLAEWGVREVEWRAALVDHLKAAYTSEKWADTRGRAARAAVLEAVQFPVEELAWRGDDPAERVLQGAIAAHRDARLRGPLGTRLLVLTIVDVARRDPAIARAAAPLVAAAAPAEVADRLAARRAELLGPPGAAPAEAAATVDLSPQVANVLETARLLAASARATADTPRVALHHVIGALVSPRVDAADELRDLGLDPAALRDATIRHVAWEHLTEDLAVWRETLELDDGAATGRPVQLDSDEPDTVVRADEAWASDPLQCRGDVTSFAALLASRSLQPPLAVGLFGPWGAGKTTFLRRLRGRIDGYAADGGDYVGQVVHVDFNAWHYAEGDLVASMVDAIQRELVDHLRPRAATGAALLTQRKDELARARARQAEAEAEKRRTDEAAEAARKASAEAQAAAASTQGALAAARDQAWSAFKTALRADPELKKTGLDQALRDVETSGTALQARVEALRNAPMKTLRAVRWPAYLAFAASVLVAPAAAAWVIEQLGHTDAVTRGFTHAATLLAAVATGLKYAGSAVARLGGALDQVDGLFAQHVEAATAKERDAAQQAADDAARAREALAAAEREQAQAAAAVDDAALPAQMDRLLADRAAHRTFSQALGTISAARADFAALGAWMREQAALGPAAGRRVERIVLYIDDLDRCEPDVVVRVLHLTHMLLAFDLFVVVVAVDERWVRHCLAEAYPWMRPGAAGGGQATTHDYLEKIFQVVFWLEPMSASRAAAYMGSLVQRAPGAAPGAPLAAWEVHPEELQFLRLLAGHVGSSPRRVKRLVNTYRLIKARQSDAQLATYLMREDGEPGAYQLVLALLVIRASAPALLDVIAESPPGETLRGLAERLHEDEAPAWRTAAAVIGTLRSTQGDETPTADLRGWARQIRRYFLAPPS